MAPACDPETLIMYLMNHAPNLTVRATLVSTDDKASYWKIVKTLLPKPAASARSADDLRSLGYLNSPKPPFPPPSAAPIPSAGERIVVRLDAWRYRAETMVRYSNPDKPGQASAEAVAAKLKEIVSKELSPGREAVLLLTDSGRLDDMPAYDAIVVIPPPSSAQGEIEKAERALLEAADRNDRLKPLEPVSWDGVGRMRAPEKAGLEFLLLTKQEDWRQTGNTLGGGERTVREAKGHGETAAADSWR